MRAWLRSRVASLVLLVTVSLADPSQEWMSGGMKHSMGGFSSFTSGGSSSSFHSGGSYSSFSGGESSSGEMRSMGGSSSFHGGEAMSGEMRSMGGSSSFHGGEAMSGEMRNSIEGLASLADPARRRAKGGIKRTQRKVIMSGTGGMKGNWSGGCRGGPRPPNESTMKCFRGQGKCEVTCKEGYGLPDGTSKTILECFQGQWRLYGDSQASIPDCSAVCSPPCENRGICIRPGFCYCGYDYEGARCELEKGAPCLETPPTPRNSKVFCSGNECTATCLPDHTFPDGTTELIIGCEDGHWAAPAGSVLPNCQRFYISGGPSPNEGNVFYNGKPICDDNWDNTDARVFCRMLGSLEGNATIKSAYGNVSSVFFMDDVKCNGTEMSLLDCPHRSVDDCGSHEGAGVICSDVSCGGHNATTCSECGPNQAYCNGDCEWVAANCVLINTATCYPPCENGGACFSFNKCQCGRSYRGDRCQSLASNCGHEKLHFNGNFNCSGTMDHYSCSIKCPAGIEMDGVAAPQYICDYATGQFNPTTAPQCIYGSNVIVSKTHKHSSSYYNTQQLSGGSSIDWNIIMSKECGEGIIFPSCDECESGWFGYPDCKPCSCSPPGSKNETCNKITGKCHCEQFHYGRSCAYTFHQHSGKNLRLDGSNMFISPGSNSNPPGSWPWGVSIGWMDGLWHHYCSGVIASTTNIITTANCLSTMELDEGIALSEMMIRAGDSFLKGRRDDDNIQTRNVLKYKIHPGYEWDYHYLDIAVITLKTPLEFNTIYVRPVYIPSHMESKEKVEMENLLLTISGWGKGGDGKEGEALKDAVVAVFPNEYCISNYNGHRLMDKLFKDDIFCGGNPVNLQGICDGDDGSPAVMLDHSKNVYTLVGLLSMSNRYNEGFFDELNNEVPHCGSTATPNIFVRIASESIVSFLYKEIHGELDPYLPEVKTPLQCGRNAIVDDTFSPGSNVGKWPWMVSVGRPNPDNLQEWLHDCGGSVVSENKVITAAHCVQDYANFSIRAGDSNLKDATDDALVQSSLVLSKDIHENYDTRYRYFDIAVLTLATPLTFTTAVRPVCLNTLEDISEKNDETFSHLVTSGWGSGDQMRDTAVMVFSELLCNKTHENRMDNRNLVPNLFTDDLLCAGDPAGESGTCQGDSGGPAVYFDATKKRYFLRAVISGSAHGICGSLQFPNIYVRVESKPIFGWIQEMINK